MRYKQHERRCEICGNTYLFYQELPKDPMETPLVYGDHPSRCPECVDAPDEGSSVEDKVKADLEEIRADLDAKREEVVGGQGSEGDSREPGYPPSDEDIPPGRGPSEGHGDFGG